MEHTLCTPATETALTHPRSGYVPGDALRRIHWAPNSSHGQLVVLEFDETQAMTEDRADTSEAGVLATNPILP